MRHHREYYHTSSSMQMPHHDRRLEFEDFSSDTEKVSAMLKRTEVSSARHKLSYEYYRARKLALLYPSVLSCAAIGILGFVVTTDAVKAHMKIGYKGEDDGHGGVLVEDVLTLIVGFLGFVVGTSVLLMNQWDLGGREAMHLSAIMELENLGSRVLYWKMDRRAGVTDDVDDDDDDDIDRELEEMETEIKTKTISAMKSENVRNDVSRFSDYNGAYHQINRSCKSVIPNALSRPFDLFESRLECMSLGHLGVIWDTRMRRNQIMRLAAMEIYNEITGYWLWPFGTPDIERVIDRSMKRVARLISKDYRAPITVECCGFTIFRLCCRKVKSKYNAFDNIWDGMEERERELIEVRGVADFVDTGNRLYRSSSKQFEEEDGKVQQKSKKMRDGGHRDQSQYSRDDCYRDRSGNSQSYYSLDEYSRNNLKASTRRDRSNVSRSSSGQSSRRDTATDIPFLNNVTSRVGHDSCSIDDSHDTGVTLSFRLCDQSIDDTLTVSEVGWDSASVSQYAL